MPEQYVYRHRVTFSETNLVGNVYFAHYLHWQGHCREHFLADHAPGVVAALSQGLALITAECSAEFYAEAHALDRIEVRMVLDHLAVNRIGMSFDYLKLVRDGTQLIARGWQTVVCMRRGDHGLEPATAPEELRRALARFAPSPDGNRGT